MLNSGDTEGSKWKWQIFYKTKKKIPWRQEHNLMYSPSYLLMIWTIYWKNVIPSLQSVYLVSTNDVYGQLLHSHPLWNQSLSVSSSVIPPQSSFSNLKYLINLFHPPHYQVSGKRMDLIWLIICVVCQIHFFCLLHSLYLQKKCTHIPKW
jgi:hypothetical protein